MFDPQYESSVWYQAVEGNSPLAILSHWPELQPSRAVFRVIDQRVHRGSAWALYAETDWTTTAKKQTAAVVTPRPDIAEDAEDAENDQLQTSGKEWQIGEPARWVGQVWCWSGR